MSFEPNPQREIRERQQQRAPLVFDRDKFAAEMAPWTTRLEQLERDIDGRLPSGHEQYEIAQLKNDIAVYREHIARLDNRIAALDAEIAYWDERSKVNLDEPLRCRLKSKVAHLHEGRLLKVGEEIVLTRRQFENLNDRFELVS